MNVFNIMYLIISTPENKQFAVGLGKEKVQDFVVVDQEYKQSELLLKTISELLDKNGNNLKDIKGVIVVQGPGCFSALRIGITTANSLAYSLGKPVVGVKLKKSWERYKEETKLEKILVEGSKILKGRKTFQMKQLVKPFYGSEPNINIKKRKK